MVGFHPAGPVSEPRRSHVRPTLVGLHGEDERSGSHTVRPSDNLQLHSSDGGESGDEEEDDNLYADASRTWPAGNGILRDDFELDAERLKAKAVKVDHKQVENEEELDDKDDERAP